MTVLPDNSFYPLVPKGPAKNARFRVLPCPRCGAAALPAYGVCGPECPTRARPGYTVVCQGEHCRTIGHFGKTPQSAIKAWNVVCDRISVKAADNLDDYQ